jgi:hypothetical protein
VWHDGSCQHGESCQHDGPCRHVAAADEEDRLRARWGRALERDPYYNPAFDRRAATFRLPTPGSLIQ